MPYTPYTTQAVIGWDNLFARATLLASSETTSGPAENAADGLTWDYWESEGDTSGDTLRAQLSVAEPADYLGIAGHNLGSVGATLTLQGSANGISWTTVAGPFSPASDKPALWRFPSATWQYWRVLVMGGPVRIGVVNVGALLVLPEGVFVGHKPESLNRRPKLSNNESEDGQFLGRSVIRRGAEGIIKQDRVTQAWVRSVWDPFARHAETKPFFWAWRYDTFPDEVMYGWTDEGAEVEQGSNGYMAVSLNVRGQVE